MTKIILLASYAPSLIKFRGPLLKAMVQKGYEVVACSPEIDGDTKSLLIEIGVTSYSVPLHRAGINPVKDLGTVLALRKLFLRERPDVLLSYTIKPVIYGSLAARFASVPKAYSMITGLGYTFMGRTFKQKWLGILTRVLYKFALANNNKIFFQNPDDCRLFIDSDLVMEGQGTVVINGSGVDLVYYNLVSLPRRLSFLLIARLIKEKGIYEFVEAARDIKLRYPSVQFVLVGGIGSEPSSISKSDLKDWQDIGLIDYRGELEDVRPAIKDATVFVLPSYREGTPRTVLESMAMGRPVITTDTPGCRETVVNGVNGYLVPVRDHEALVNAMEQFICHSEIIEKMGLCSRRMAEKKYDVDKVNYTVMQEMGLYDEMFS